MPRRPAPPAPPAPRPSPPSPPPDTRTRILAAAAQLVAEGGADAATTRAVAAAADVQAPVIYRLFGDKEGLLDAVAEQALADHMARKAKQQPSTDPVEDLRQGWFAHIAFGVANPAVFVLVNTPRAGPPPAAWSAGIEMLRVRVRRIAQAGRLRVSEERAVDLLQALGTGAVLGLLSKPADGRGDLAEVGWQAVYSLVITEPAKAKGGAAPRAGAPADAVSVASAASAASTLRARLDGPARNVLSAGERALLDELLQRIAASGA